MLRKTVSIDESLLFELQNNGVMEQFKNFSELVSQSLRETMLRIKRENYRKSIAQAANDPMVKADIEDITNDFKYSENLDVF